MGDFENIFEKRLKQLGIKKQVDASMIVEDVQKKIKEALGSRGAENLRAISYKNGVLKIAAANNLWAAECQGKINKIKKPPVERVIFEIRDVNNILPHC